MNTIKRFIPNGITLLNILSGTIAIILALSFGNLELAALFIFIGAVFDFFDGMVARLLGVTSNIGKDLDSLSDVVTFGVAPSILLFKGLWMLSNCPWSGGLAILIGAFACYRLAKFNNDTRQTSSFLGLPVPANAIFWIGYTLYLTELKEMLGLMPTFYLTYALILVIGYLMISDLPMFSFKVKKLSLGNLKFQLLLIIISISSIVILSYFGLAISILAYILLSVIESNLSKEK